MKVPNKTGILTVQGFPPREVTLPGRMSSSTRNLDFSSPHPYLLLLRALNAWFDYLHSYKVWPEWTHHIKEIAKGSPHGGALLSARLVLLPGCCDVSRYDPDCVQCKCNCLITSPELYGDLPEDLLEKAKMFIFNQIALSMDSCDSILEVKSDIARTNAKRKHEKAQLGDDCRGLALRKSSNVKAES